MDSRLYLSPPYMCGGEQKYINEAFETNWIAPLGPQVAAFEREMALFTGMKYSLAANSGTAAIHLALRYLGVGSGDIVFCSSFTFAASCNPILYQNAEPVFIDSEPESGNMSPEALKSAFEWAKNNGKIPKAVIIVDLYGQSADFDRLLPICREYGVPVIEDAAEALGAEYKGKKCGSFGYISIFSFNGNKIITTSGGGMALSNDEAAISKMLFWATQAREKALHYEHEDYGYNYRMPSICAAVGRGQLEGLRGKIERRKQIHDYYVSNFEGFPIELIPEYEQPNYWLSVALLDKNSSISPADICNALEKENIESRPAWKPMQMQPIFNNCKFFAHDHDVSADLFARGICLPSGEAMTAEQQNEVCRIIKSKLA